MKELKIKEERILELLNKPKRGYNTLKNGRQIPNASSIERYDIKTIFHLFEGDFSEDFQIQLAIRRPNFVHLFKEPCRKLQELVLLPNECKIRISPMLLNKIDDDFQDVILNEKTRIDVLKRLVGKFDVLNDEYQARLIEHNIINAQFIKNPSIEIQMKVIEKGGGHLEYIQNPHESVVFAALEKSSTAIRFVKNPTKAMQRFALKKNPRIINYIRKKTTDEIDPIINMLEI